MFKNNLSIFIGACLVCLYLTEGVTWEPVPRTEKSWMNRHLSFVENSRVNGSNIKIVFLGSSSIERWSTTGGSIWRSKYEPLGAVNYGIGADKLENCLWRIQNGELENINPKLLVVYCGTRNIRKNSSEAIIEGITEMLEDLTVRLPQTKILYVNFNPRTEKRNTERTWNKKKAINTEITLLDDGDKINVFTMFDELISSWGHIKTELFENDQLHLNEAGYATWDNLWNGTLTNLLKN